MCQPIQVFVVGASGLIGNEVTKMLVDLPGDRVILRGICDSTHALYLSDQSVVPGWKVNKNIRWRVKDYAMSEGTLSQAQFDGSAPTLLEFTTPDRNIDSAFHTVVIDCTASDVPTSLYLSWLTDGIHVVSANKKANSGSFDYYKKCCLLSSSPLKGKWFTETTCGAGLPVIKTIRNLVDTGDTIENIQGIFSGTMSYLFNTWKPPAPFSEIVNTAKSNGYTEPDPRQDLNGLDVARKVVILARECGLEISLDDVSIESLVPDSLADCSVEEFVELFPSHNSVISDKAAAASSRNCVLRFLGRVDIKNKKASVSLAEVDCGHPFATLTGADNIIEITSERCGPSGGSTPMIIRGPGAGAAVTAAGVVGDVLDLVQRLR